MKPKPLSILMAMLLCFVGTTTFGQSLSVKKQPSGNGPILNMQITDAKAVGNLGGLCEFGASKSVPCSDRIDVQIHTSNNTISPAGTSLQLVPCCQIATRNKKTRKTIQKNQVFKTTFHGNISKG